MQSDRTITKSDVQKLEAEMRSRGLSQAVLALFQEEPELYEAMGETWNQIVELIDLFGLSNTQKAALRNRIVAHTMKGMVLLHRAHRNLWADLLPDDVETGA